MKNILLTGTIFCLLLIPLKTYGQEYSLEELFRLSLDRSELVKIAEEDLTIADLSRKKTISAFVPTFSVFANHINYTEEKNSPFALLQPDYTNQWGARVEQTFSFSGRELTAYKRAKDNIAKSRFSLQKAKEDRLINVAGSYFNLMKSM